MSRTITNQADLPLPLYNALAANTYVGGGDISATRLIAPPRIVALRKYHEDEIIEDATARIWSLLGSSVHRMLELAAGDDIDMTVESRLIMPFQGIELPDGPWRWQVSGQPDLYWKSRKSLWDYKVTSVWSTINVEKPEFEKQINIQAMLHRHKGDEVEQGFIVAILRDWIVRKARVEKDYPAAAVKVIGVPMWTQEEAIDYVLRRVKLHQQAQLDYEEAGMDANALPMCTDDERWYRGHVYATKFMEVKTGKVNKNAKRKFTSRTDALQYMADNPTLPPKDKKWAEIEERPGENIRCLDYCDVAEFCPFGKNLRALANAALVNEKDSEETEG